MNERLKQKNNRVESQDSAAEAVEWDPKKQDRWNGLSSAKLIDFGNKGSFYSMVSFIIRCDTNLGYGRDCAGDAKRATNDSLLDYLIKIRMNSFQTIRSNLTMKTQLISLTNSNSIIFDLAIRVTAIKRSISGEHLVY